MARSRSRGSESKQTLVVILVLSILLNLLLAIVGYLGYAGQDENIKALNQKNELLKLAQASEKKEASLKYLHMLADGSLETLEHKDDKDNYNNIKNLQTLAKDLDAEAKKITLLAWDPDQRVFKRNFAEELDATRKALSEEQKSRLVEREKAEDVRKKLEKAVLEAEAMVKKANKDRDDASAAIKARIGEIDTNYQATNKKFNDAIEKYTADQKMIAQLNKDLDDAKGDIVKLKSVIDQLTLRKKELEQKVFADSMLNYEKPKGKVIRVDPQGTTVYLNVGKADLLKTGVTFSIFSPNAFKGSTDSKAKCEVTQIIDDHLSMARVTETKNAVRDPILSGDDLFNIGWSPGLKTHVALVGFVALNGDGRDNTAEFVRNLEATGVVVDRWMNPKERSTEKLKVRDKDKVDEVEVPLPCKFAGPGINTKTTYVIEADLPELAAQDIGDAKVGAEDKQNLRRAALSILEDATAVGATKISLRQYLALSGYKTPRILTAPSDSSLNIGRPARAADGEKKDPPAKIEK